MPHSDTPGSTPVDGSPGLFAVPRVLLRPSAPRHPPRALFRSAPPRGDPEPPGSDTTQRPDPASTLAPHHSSPVKGPRSRDLWLKARCVSSSQPRIVGSAGQKNRPDTHQAALQAKPGGFLLYGRPAPFELFSVRIVNLLAYRPNFSRQQPSIPPRPSSCKPFRPPISGGDGRIRTPDLPRARRALSH